jgi:DNA-binding Lrp family transcriptional regulator
MSKKSKTMTMEVNEIEANAIHDAREQAQLIKEAQRNQGDGRAFAMIDTKNMSTLNKILPVSNERKLLDFFIYKMNKNNAVIISQKKLQKLLSVSRTTVGNIIKKLSDARIIDVVKVGSSNAYVVNSQVAWKSNRAGMKEAVFTATVIADWDDQMEDHIKQWNTPLVSLSKPVLYEAMRTIEEEKREEALIKMNDKKEETAAPLRTEEEQLSFETECFLKS